MPKLRYFPDSNVGIFYARILKCLILQGGEIMARDGTNRGGARPGAGRPKKALSEKIASGNPGE